jgi:hypothetical protein
VELMVGRVVVAAPNVAVKPESLGVVGSDGVGDMLVDGGSHEEVGNYHTLLLPKPPCTAHGLAVSCWIPAQLNKDDLGHLL